MENNNNNIISYAKQNYIMPLLLGIWAFITAIISLAINSKYGIDYFNEVIAYPKTDFQSKKLINTGVFLGVLTLIYIFIVGAYSMTGQEVTGKIWIELLVPVAIIGTVVIGSTMILINVLPVMMRTFENTIGFFFIKNNDLNTYISAIIEDASKNNVLDYTVLATQLYVENFKAYLGSMLPNINNGASISKFTNVFVKKNIFTNNGDGELDMNNNENVKLLLEKIITKRAISETTWISLAALFSLFGSYYYVV